MNVLVVQLCLTPCNPMDYRPPGSSVHGILQQKDWSGLPFPSPGEIPHPPVIHPFAPTPQHAGEGAEA